MIRQSRCQNRASSCAMAPMRRVPVASSATMTHPASVAATAGAAHPTSGTRPKAANALTTIATSAKRKGDLVSDRAKYSGCCTFCSTKAGRPSP